MLITNEIYQDLKNKIITEVSGIGYVEKSEHSYNDEEKIIDSIYINLNNNYEFMITLDLTPDLDAYRLNNHTSSDYKNRTMNDLEKEIEDLILIKQIKNIVVNQFDENKISLEM